MVDNGASGMDATKVQRLYITSKAWIARTVEQLKKLVDEKKQDAIWLDIWMSEARKRQLNYEEAFCKLKKMVCF